MILNLIYKGNDDWNRPVYIDVNGTLWKDVNPDSRNTPDLCTCMDNQFYGEPLTNMCYIHKYDNAVLNFIPKRITW